MSLGNAVKYNKETGEFEFTDGYKYENLNSENKGIMTMLEHLIDSIDGFRFDYEVETPGTTILEKIKNEIALEVIDKLKEYLESTKSEIQISLIENQEDTLDEE